jgi:hypothetical protein
MAISKYPVCLITGCALFDPVQERALWGDLHMLGSGTFVFNGVLKGFDASWMYGDEAKLIADPRNRVLALVENAPVFERRGVVVFDRLHCTFNGTARTFLQSSPNWKE